MTTLDALRATPLFAQLPEADLRRLADMAQPLSLGPGELHQIDDRPPTRRGGSS